MATVTDERSGDLHSGRTRALFVNAGILGMQSFSKYIREAMSVDPDIEAHHVNLTDGLTLDERIVRRAMCARVWPDGLLGLRNADFARLRQEFHAGFQAARRIRRIMAHERVDILHFHRQTTAYASVRLMRRVPSIVSIDATQDAVIDFADTAFERWTYGANASIDGAIMRAASAVVATSDWAAGCLRRRYPDCTTPVHVMPPPVRLRFFDEGWIEERFARARGAWKPHVLFVGGDFVRKGGDELLEAWRLGGFHRRAMLDLVTDWPVDITGFEGVRLVRDVGSYSTEWSALWRTADVFVMPTRAEAFGLVFQEAAAAGLPAIGTSINAVPEIIVHGGSGFLVPPRDPKALAGALEALLQSAEVRRRLGAAARARMFERAHPDTYQRQLRGLLLSAVGARTNRAGVAA